VYQLCIIRCDTIIAFGVKGVKSVPPELEVVESCEAGGTSFTVDKQKSLHFSDIPD